MIIDIQFATGKMHVKFLKCPKPQSTISNHCLFDSVFLLLPDDTKRKDALRQITSSAKKCRLLNVSGNPVFSRKKNLF